MARDNRDKDKSNRIYNWPRAVFYVLSGLGLGVLLGVWLWRSWAGGGGLFTDLSTCAEWTTDVILTIVLGYVVIVLVWIGLTAPVFWSEIGEKLVFRKPLGVQISKWSDVEMMEFSKDKCNDAATVTSQKRRGKRRLEIALLESGMELTIAIPPEHYDRIVKLAAEHGFMLDESKPDAGGAGETVPGPSEVISELPQAPPEPADRVPESSEPVPEPSESSPELPQILPELPKDAAKPSTGVTRLFDILTASVESEPEPVKHTSKSAKSGSKSAKSRSKSSKRRSKRSKRSKRSRKKRR